MLIRNATLEDAPDIAYIMQQLGYGVSECLIQEKLYQFSSYSSEAVFVAEKQSEIVGIISCHITRLFHQKGNSGRITSLVVDQSNRGNGIGTALARRAEQFFKENNCIKAEVTSGRHRTDAHTFYSSLGFQQDEPRFIKTYSESAPTQQNG